MTRLILLLVLFGCSEDRLPENQVTQEEHTLNIKRDKSILQVTNTGKELGVCTTSGKYSKYGHFIWKAPDNSYVTLQYNKIGRDKNTLYGISKTSEFTLENIPSERYPCPQLTVHEITKEELDDFELWDSFFNQVPNFYLSEDFREDGI